jgi:iron complex transport system substrate-binding protein
LAALAWLPLALAAPFAAAADYPVTVQSCNREVTFTQAPRRAVSHDINLTGMLLALGLRDQMAGYTGISGWKTLDPRLQAALEGLPELAPRYPSVENLLAAETDLFFAGWNYGMHVGGPVTPESLQRFAIPVYELTESCSKIRPQGKARFEDLYTDLTRLGQIFAVPERAQALVSGLRQRLQAVRTSLAGVAERPRVFVYDSGEDRPFTAGRLAMPQAIIEAAGGSNVMADVNASWSAVSWEALVERDPQVILIVDYGPISWQAKRDFLLSQPALAGVRAIRDRRFAVLPYLAVTPSVENAEAVAQLAATLHPGLFAPKAP